ncbi:hypothetical protein Hanom_Chr05g00465541 [Helianthus anomalus]
MEKNPKIQCRKTTILTTKFLFLKSIIYQNCKTKTKIESNKTINLAYLIL